MEKMHKNVHVFVFGVNFKHESTKICMFSCNIFVLNCT